MNNLLKVLMLVSIGNIYGKSVKLSHSKYSKFSHSKSSKSSTFYNHHQGKILSSICCTIAGIAGFLYYKSTLSDVSQATLLKTLFCSEMPDDQNAIQGPLSELQAAGADISENDDELEHLWQLAQQVMPISHMTTELQTAEARIKTCTSELQEAQIQNNTLRTELEKAEARIKTLLSDRNTSQAQGTANGGNDLCFELLEAEDQIRQLKDEASDHYMNMIDAEDQIRQLKDENNALIVKAQSALELTILQNLYRSQPIHTGIFSQILEQKERIILKNNYHKISNGRDATIYALHTMFTLSKPDNDTTMDNSRCSNDITASYVMKNDKITQYQYEAQFQCLNEFTITIIYTNVIESQANQEHTLSIEIKNKNLPRSVSSEIIDQLMLVGLEHYRYASEFITNTQPLCIQVKSDNTSELNTRCDFLLEKCQQMRLPATRR